MAPAVMILLILPGIKIKLTQLLERDEIQINDCRLNRTLYFG